MHRALLIQEITCRICSLANDLSSLAMLARTCKDTHEPAICVLWEEVQDLAPLVQCFPHDSWSVVETELTFTRPLASEDWDRFLHYSRHIRNLRLRNPTRASRYRVHSSVISTLDASRPEPVLFPCVHIFEWDAEMLGYELLDTCLGFLGAQVRYIHLGHPHLCPDRPECGLRAGLSAIAHQFPSLEHVYLGHSFADVYRGPPPISEALLLPERLSALRTFCIYGFPIAEAVVYALATLPSLEILKVTLPFDSTWSGTFPSKAFSTVKQVFLRMTAPDYISFSAVAKFPSVGEAYLEVIDVPKQSTTNGFYEAIRRQFSPRSLLQLEVSPAGTFPYAVVAFIGSVVRPTHLEPLFDFFRLESLTLSMACRYSLDTAFYANASRAFPQLCTFKIADCYWCVNDTLPTMTALVPFALHPNLSDLFVPFDGTQPVSLSGIKDALPPGTGRSHVTSLGVGYSPLTVSHPQLVAAYLSRLFPRLGGQEGRSLMWGECDETAEGHQLQERWKKVRELLTCFYAIREDERDITARELTQSQETARLRCKGSTADHH
ncbi:hypothetical protein L226DRAFT_328883 [Lentinus tigrinus ALCF2SS1-7]|uniref:uncharacterized protein n=1 Tax=Lentinus tigrinus ALCF2SS1-7 TaxID=1328758 RepID=UPI0011661865|nr:hypothetical protein L226DRAFT_328883 [Lentinus tigrinus ALCF2SS1-7]